MIAFLLTATFCAFAAPLDEGVTAFDEARLVEAVNHWSEVPAETRGWAVSYNLSLAKYRQGEVGEAIGLLREAKLRSPRNGAVHHNLAYLRSELGAVPKPVDEARSWLNVMTAGELGAWSGLCGAAGLLIVFRRRRDPSLGATGPWWLLWMAGSLGVLLSWDAAQQSVAHPVAVVTADEVALRDAPVLDGAARADLALGSEVRVAQCRTEWCLVEDGRSRRGWVSRHTLFVAHAESVD